MKLEQKKPILFAFAALSTLLAVTACNTVKGAGEDIQGAGGAISDTAKEVKEDMKN